MGFQIIKEHPISKIDNALMSVALTEAMATNYIEIQATKFLLLLLLRTMVLWIFYKGNGTDQ